MTPTLKGATVLITGGTGTFGSAFLDRCLDAGAREVRIFSRDEKKQYDLSQRYREKPVSFFIGDVRDANTLTTPMLDVDYVFHAAAMKQVPSCEQFPMEAVKTNVIGCDNVLTCAIKRRVKKVVCLSTDKAVYPTSAMGMTKAYMEKIAMQKAAEQSRTAICITRFGNLIASRGSVVPLFMDLIRQNLPITITEPNMTRYIMTVSDAVDLVETAFQIGNSGDLFIRSATACTVGQLSKAVCRYMHVGDDYPVQYIGARRGEKLHECMLTNEEAVFARVAPSGNFVVVRQNGTSVPKPLDDGNPFSSDRARQMTDEEIINLLEEVFGGERE